MNRAQTVRSLFVALTVALAMSGCSGQTGPGQYDLSGSVVYNGKPVPAGEISLEPDGSRGNAGPGCIALIQNGTYQTMPGKGIVGGAYFVRIVGFDGAAVGESSLGTPLFPPYETQVELPCESTTHDFIIPASAGRR